MPDLVEPTAHIEPAKGHSNLGVPVFVCGYPKSGTTLLTALLDGHSQISVFPEETFFLAKVARQQQITVDEALNFLLVDSSCGKHLEMSTAEGAFGNIDYSDVDFDSLRQRVFTLVQNGPQSLGHVLTALVTAYSEETGQAGKRYWVEKSPGNECFLGLAAKWYPEARFIYLVRDPRDTYLSYLRLRQSQIEKGWPRKPLTMAGFITDWGLSVWHWQQHLAYSPNCMTVRFEDLVTAPQETAKMVCKFLGLEHEPALEVPTRNGKAWWGNSMHSDKFTGVSTKPIGRWRQKLEPEAVIAIEAFLGRCMTWYGYQLANPLCSVRQFIQVWSRMGNWRQKRKCAGMTARLYWPFNPRRRRG